MGGDKKTARSRGRSNSVYIFMIILPQVQAELVLLHQA